MSYQITDGLRLTGSLEFKWEKTAEGLQVKAPFPFTPAPYFYSFIGSHCEGQVITDTNGGTHKLEETRLEQTNVMLKQASELIRVLFTDGRAAIALDKNERLVLPRKFPSLVNNLLSGRMEVEKREAFVVRPDVLPYIITDSPVLGISGDPKAARVALIAHSTLDYPNEITMSQIDLKGPGELIDVLRNDYGFKDLGSGYLTAERALGHALMNFASIYGVYADIQGIPPMPTAGFTGGY